MLEPALMITIFASSARRRWRGTTPGLCWPTSSQWKIRPKVRASRAPITPRPAAQYFRRPQSFFGADAVARLLIAGRKLPASRRLMPRLARPIFFRSSIPVAGTLWFPEP
ncbi:MAG: hypothetical protein R3B68_12575 [Phycisphaerales bacterium]